MKPPRRPAQHRLLRGALLLCLLLGWTGQTSGQSPSPPPFSAPLLSALEDQDFAQARALLTPLLQDNPQALELRALRVQLEAGADTAGFLTQNLPAGGPRTSAPTEAEVFEALQARLTRAELERRLYRGDMNARAQAGRVDLRDPPPAEDAAAFQARLEGELSDIDQGLTQLHAQNPGSMRVKLSLALTRKLQGALGTSTGSATSSPLEPLHLWVPQSPWETWWTVSGIELGVFPGADALPWLERFCAPVPVPARRSTAPEGGTMLEPWRLPSPLTERCRVLALELESRRLDWDQTAARYAEVLGALESAQQTSPWLDDLRLAAGRAHARGYTPAIREAALTYLQKASSGAWCSSTHPATLELSGLLRRMRRLDQALTVVEDYHARFPTTPWRLDREEGRIAYQQERFERAMRAFQASIESPRGKGGDYLLLAEATRAWLAQQPAPAQEDKRRLLTLTDFAQAALEQEARVVGWMNHRPLPLTELYARLTELNVLMTHATLFPLPFVVAGLTAFWQTLAVALGVLLIASFARRARVLWRPCLLGAVLMLYLPVGAAALMLEADRDPPGAGSLLAFSVQGGIRLFFLLLVSRVLASERGLSRESLVRWVRVLRGKRPRAAWSGVGWTGLAFAGLLLLGFLSRGEGIPALTRTPGVYLERFPALLVGAELGAPVQAMVLERFPEGVLAVPAALLRLYHGLQVELLARGLVLGGLLVLLQGLDRLRQDRARAGQAARQGLAVAVAALVSASLELGGYEPTVGAFAMAGTAGALLGLIRVKGGLSASLLGMAGWRLLAG